MLKRNIEVVASLSLSLTPCCAFDVAATDPRCHDCANDRPLIPPPVAVDNTKKVSNNFRAQLSSRGEK
jgi:hypothetical protein